MHFITMELVEGKSLDQIVPSGGPTPDQVVALELLRQAIGNGYPTSEVAVDPLFRELRRLAGCQTEGTARTRVRDVCTICDLRVKKEKSRVFCKIDLSSHSSGVASRCPNGVFEIAAVN